jgi:seryl-tRNA synthetase
MLDIRYIRDNAKEVEEKSKQKGYSVDVSSLLKRDEARRDLLQKAEVLRQHRNELAEAAKGSKPTDEQITKGRELKEELAHIDEKLQQAEADFIGVLKKVPNMPLDHVPVGHSEDENQVTKTVGEPPKFNFEPKNHWQIAEARDLIDKERAAKIAGSRFAYIKGGLVRLQFAIVQWVMNTLADETILQRIIDENGLKVTAKPFVPIIPPALIRTEPYEATARLNKEEVTYKVDHDDLWLNASAEHSLVPMYMNEILPEEALPIRYIGYSTSFRREAGTYGKDMEGMFRMHQFDKLEMESFTTADDGLEEHKFLIAIQEHLMQQLKIPYQVLQKCTFDIGGPNAAGVDINAWMPGQNHYRETHTADYMTDYQARRLHTRVRRASGEVQLVHTNDATAMPLSRGPIAIIVNYQQADGSIAVPEVLRPYFGGDVI